MKIYVGNIPYTATEESLRATFEQYGAVEAVSIVIDRESGRSRGFAFVTMPNLGEANAAIEALNGKELGGRSLTVNEARAKKPTRPPSRGYGPDGDEDR